MSANDNVGATHLLCQTNEVISMGFKAVRDNRSSRRVLEELGSFSGRRGIGGGKHTDFPYPIQSGQTTRNPRSTRSGICFLQPIERSGKP
jgi:hypothetical protein